MNARRLAEILGWLSFGLAVIGAVAVYDWADQQVEMITVYKPLWVYKTAFFGPLLTAIFLVWQLRLFNRESTAVILIMLALVSFIGLMEVLPRAVVLLDGSDAAATPLLQELELVSVRKHYARSSFVSTQVGIRYQDNVLQFATSRSNYFLLRHKTHIRAEIGQMAPQFYYVRHLQLAPGEQRRARQTYWLYWWSEFGAVVGSMVLILGAAWLLTRIPGVKNRLSKINR